MASTVLITGCSSGIGRATAELFAAHDWNVVATMRDVSAAGDLADPPGLSIAALDVTDESSIERAVSETVAIRTNFATAPMDLTIDDELTEYAGLSAAMAHSFATIDDTASDPAIVADVIHAAATDGTDQVRYTAGADAADMIAGRAAAGDEAFIAGLRARFAG